MPHVHLPVHHTEADLILAGQVAHFVRSGELFVTWSHETGPGALPVVPAHLREPINPVAELLGILLESAAGLWRSLTRAPGAEPRHREPSPAQRSLS
ncbi:MAG: hypothetical protein M3P40_10315 [Actinomycetota bacterium]|nr:hypothetical protein [Actinomycetota bacterium]